MLSGGSMESTSLIWFASTFTEQTVPSGRSLVGSSVADEPGEPLTPKLSGVPLGHSSVNELPVAVTGSLKFTTMFVFTATWSAPSAGEVLETLGAASAVANEKLEFAAGWSGGLPSQTIVNELVSAVTGSLKKTWMLVEALTSVAPSVGELPVTAGAASVV